MSINQTDSPDPQINGFWVDMANLADKMTAEELWDESFDTEDNDAIGRFND